MLSRTLIWLFLFTLSANASDTWLHNYEDALSLARKGDKKVLIYFSGSDWCRPCILLKKKVFETDRFEKYAAENLILVQFDFPAREKNKLSEEQTQYNEKMAERFNQDGDFPKVLLVSKDENTLQTLVGYGNESTEDYIKKLYQRKTEK